MPLAMIEAGAKARIVSVAGQDAVRKHLGSLGFVPGAVVTVVQKTGDNMIIGIHDGRVAINDTLSRKLTVEPVTA